MIHQQPTPQRNDTSVRLAAMRMLLFVALLFAMVRQADADERKMNIHASAKPRVVILTDVSTWETDDSESLVRLLVHADMLEIEGIVFTTGWSLETIREDFMGLIHDAIKAYEKDLPNLTKRSQQKSFPADEQKQTIGSWPSAEYLRSRTVIGSRKRGFKEIGEGNDSPGSELIIRLADEPDDRPLWITFWGGGNTMAQAIWRVQQDRTDAELKTFLRKLRVYAITDQDREQRTLFTDSSHLWMRREFGKDLMFLWDECAWMHQNGTGKNRWSDYEAHIQGHGHLGRVYPKYKYGVEGDTPSFSYLLPIGLSDPEVPGHGGWGGYFEFGKSADGETSCYSNSNGDVKSTCSRLLNHFYEAQFNNFAARMDWAKDGSGNRNPVIIVNDDDTLNILKMQAAAKSTVSLDASASSDPDGNHLTFRWWILPEAGTKNLKANVESGNTAKARLSTPVDFSQGSIHVICEATDNGVPPLTSYRRIIIEPSNP